MNQKTKDKILCLCGSLIVLGSCYLYAWVIPTITNDSYIKGYTNGSHWALDTMEKVIIRTKNNDSICDLRVWEGKDTFHCFLTNKNRVYEK